MLQKMGRPYVRTTLKLAGTVSTGEAKLDHTSRLALDYCRARLRADLEGVDPTTSGVIRRALQFYARHLSAEGTDPAEEATAVRRVCSAIAPPQEAKEAAHKRLDEAGKGSPFPSFSEVLHGPAVAQEVAALNAQADALAEQLLKERPTLRRRKVLP